MKVTVLQHTIPLTAEECAASIIKVAFKMKIEAAHSFKLLTCVMPKYIKEDPNLHWNVISIFMQTVPTCCQCVHTKQQQNDSNTTYHIWSLIFFPSNSIVLILKSIPERGNCENEHCQDWN